MSKLGEYLKALRQQRDRSRRWVERQSRTRYASDRQRQVSHSYLGQIEEGVCERPSPLKLQTLAEVYEVDYGELMAAAGYLESWAKVSLVPEPSEQPEDQPEQEGLVREAMAWLERNGVHSAYFLRSLTGLSNESLNLVNRLVTSLSIHEKQLEREDAPSALEAEKSKV